MSPASDNLTPRSPAKRSSSGQPEIQPLDQFMASGNTGSGSIGPGISRTVSGRELEKTAAARCACYSAFSDLLASPHEIDSRASCRDKIGIGRLVPYADGLDDIMRELVSAEPLHLKSEYSRLFEVGDQGAPAPIREDLMTGQKAGVREEIVRFYDFFGYALEEGFAWAPDHLSVELEFMHFLCFRESQADKDVLSSQLAQVDFTERHLCNWVPALRERVEELAPGTLYCRAVTALSSFLGKDLAWQRQTINTVKVTNKHE